MKYLTILCLIIGLQATGQDLKKEADESFNNQKWEEAAKRYSKYLKKNKTDSSAWYRLAFSTMKSGAPGKSLEYYDKALETNFFPTSVHFSKGKAYALMEKREAMYNSLRASTDQGFVNFKRLQQDEEFADYQEEVAFLEIVELSRVNAYPCLSDEKRRHFDFWIGEWEVYVKGNKVGDNSITMANGGCAIHESYTTPGAYTGQSINYYDPQDEKWHQTWVGSGGGVLDYVEIDKADGVLQFQCDYLNQKGEKAYSRLTFTANEDGTVRQLFENSSDGENWTPGFDGLYKPKEE